VQRASRLDTATLSDALDRHGLNRQCYKIKPRSSDFRMTGRAWTLLYGDADGVVANPQHIYHQPLSCGGLEHSAGALQHCAW